MSDRVIVRSSVRDYEVCFVRAGTFARSLTTTSERHVLIVDKRVLELYDDLILPATSPSRLLIPVEASEQNKTIDGCKDVVQRLVDAGIRKNDVIVALGGGVTQDIAGFVASILYRGIGWEFYPTTLLAQADSCIGGKTSINLGRWKNLVGSFYPPTRVVIDSGFLGSLPEREIRSGIGEILHFYLVAGEDRIEGLMAGYEQLLADRSGFEDHVRASLAIKQKTIEIDEFDRKERRLFNYGHTFGHAIESVSGYAVTHGEAVTLGMSIANYVSWRLGLLKASELHRIQMLLEPNMPAFRLTPARIAEFIEALARDKKNVGLDLNCILTGGAGRMREARVPLDGAFRQMLEDYCSGSVVPRAGSAGATGAGAADAPVS